MALPNEPITRQEMYLSNIAGQNTALPDAPITREEMYLDYIAKSGGTGEGDMKKSIYDSDNSVATAGGIKMFVNQKIGTLPQRVGSLETTAGVLEGEVASIEDTLDGLGTASTKNSTSVVTQSTDLVESGAVKDLVGWGNKNLLQIIAASQTINNVAFTVNDNGTISTANTSNADWSTLVLNRFTLSKGSYIVSGCNGGSQPTYRMSVGKQGVELALVYDGEASFELLEDTEILVQITVRNANVDMNGKIFYPMLRKAGTSATFEPYHESVIDTLRDAEVIDSVNLWDEVWEYGSISGSDGTNISDSTYIRSKNYIPVDSGNVYKIINGNRTGKVFFIYYNENKTHVGISAQSVDSNTDFSPNVNTAKYMRFTFFNNGNQYGNDVIFGYANEVTVYEPYYVPLKDVVPTKADNSVIGTVEDGTTCANPNGYKIGEHFIRNRKFCTVASAISANESLVGSSKFTSGDVAESLSCVKGFRLGTFQFSSTTGTSAGNVTFDKPFSSDIDSARIAVFLSTISGNDGFIFVGSVSNITLTGFSFLIKNIGEEIAASNRFGVYLAVAY